MKRTHLVLLLVAVMAPLSVFVACNKEEGSSAEQVSEIAGTWTATSATFNGVDVVGEGGSVTLVIQTNGRFTFTIMRPGTAAMVFTGKLGFDEQWLEVEYDTDPGEYEYYDISYDAHNMHIGANSVFDFDGDGTPEEVIFFLEMIR
jgi:hypothetical protein